MNQKVRKGEELNEHTLKEFLQRNDLINDLKSDLNVVQYSNGFSNLTYLLQIENKEFVLRRPPVGAKYGHDMGREYKVLSALNKGFDKAPKTYAFCENEQVIGANFYLMEKVEGVILTMKEALKRKVSEQAFEQIVDSWLNTYVELHNLDYKSLGLGELGKPNGYVERQINTWTKQYLKAKTDEVKEAEIVMKWLAENQPKKYNHCLIHNDFRYDNIVFEEGNWKKVNAILDWEMCTLGDPLMDLGTSLSYWSTAQDHEMVQKGLASPTTLAGNPNRAKLVEMYAQKSGKSIDNLVFYYVYGLFKLAVIVQQIYYRYNKGLTNDPKFKNLNHTAALLCLIGTQAINKNRIDKLF